MGQRPTHRRTGRPSVPQNSASEFFRVLAVCCFLFLMVLLVFGQACQFEFILCDDEPYVYDNQHVVDGLGPSAWKSWEDNPILWSLTTNNAGNWHPLTWMSHIVDGAIYGVHGTGPQNADGSAERWRGPEAGGHHMTNVLLHAAAAIVLFLAMRQLTGTFWCSALVATMFALHPLRAESVAWVAERKDVLSGLFWMLTLLAYAMYAMRPSKTRYLALILVFAAGLTAKSMLVTLPCVLLLLDVWPLRRWQPKLLYGEPTEAIPSRGQARPLGRLLLEKAPLFALSALVSIVVARGQQSMGYMSMTDAVSCPCRLANASYSAVAYLGKMAWPIDITQSVKQGSLVCNLCIFYPHLAVTGADKNEQLANIHRLMWYGAAGALILAAITAFVIWNLRRRPYLAVGWFWYLGTLVPVIGLVQVGAQGMADRYTYLPMIGICIMIVWSAAELVTRRPRWRDGLLFTIGGVLAIWAVLTTIQVSTWRTTETVFQHAVDVTNDNYFAYNHLGLAYQFDRSKPNNEEKARETFEKAVHCCPSYDAANGNLGSAYMKQKEYEKALECFQRAAKVNPYGAVNFASLARAYIATKKLGDAEDAMRKAIEIDPGEPRYHQRMAEIFFRKGEPALGVAELEKSLKLCPQDLVAMTDLAYLLATHPDAAARNGERSLVLALEVNEQTHYRFSRPLIVLAAAHAELRHFEAAVTFAKKAEKIAVNTGDNETASFCRRLIAGFGSRKPLREQAEPQ